MQETTVNSPLSLFHFDERMEEAISGPSGTAICSMQIAGSYDGQPDNSIVVVTELPAHPAFLNMSNAMETMPPAGMFFYAHGHPSAPWGVPAQTALKRIHEYSYMEVFKQTPAYYSNPWSAMEERTYHCFHGPVIAICPQNKGGAYLPEILRAATFSVFDAYPRMFPPSSEPAVKEVEKYLEQVVQEWQTGRRAPALMLSAIQALRAAGAKADSEDDVFAFTDGQLRSLAEKHLQSSLLGTLVKWNRERLITDEVARYEVFPPDGAMPAYVRQIQMSHDLPFDGTPDLEYGSGEIVFQFTQKHIEEFNRIAELRYSKLLNDEGQFDGAETAFYHPLALAIRDRYPLAPVRVYAAYPNGPKNMVQIGKRHWYLDANGVEIASFYHYGVDEEGTRMFLGDFDRKTPPILPPSPLPISATNSCVQMSFTLKSLPAQPSPENSFVDEGDRQTEESRTRRFGKKSRKAGTVV